MSNQIKKFKDSFTSSAKFVHLNNAGMSPTSLPARIAVESWIARFFDEGDRCAPEAYVETEATRVALADFLGATKNETAFFSTTGAALSQVALGSPLASGDEIIVWDQEY